MSVSIFFCYAHEDEPYLNKLNAFFGSAPSGLVDSVLSYFSTTQNVSTAHPIDVKSLEQKGEPAHGIL